LLAERRSLGDRMSVLPRISDDVVIREEYFGALIFDRRSLSVTEANESTLRLLRLVDGKRTMEEVAEAYGSVSELPKAEVLAFLEEIRRKGIVEC